jgi:hypothetical protein
MTGQDKLAKGVRRLRIPEMPFVELFGHVTLIQGYALTDFVGCHALVALRDTPGKTVAVVTSEQRLQTLLETALDTRNLIAFEGHQFVNPPTLGGAPGSVWDVDVYDINSVILYSFS